MSVVGANISVVVTYKHVCIMAAHLSQRHDTNTQKPVNKLQPGPCHFACSAVRALLLNHKKKKGKKRSTKLQCCPMQVEAVESSKRPSNACMSSKIHSDPGQGARRWVFNRVRIRSWYAGWFRRH